MKKFAKIILPTVLAISLLVPASAFAHGGKFGGHHGKGMKHHHAGAKFGMPCMKHKQPFAKHGKRHHAKADNGLKGAMKQTFFTLLVEKYSPDTLASWEATFIEGQTLRDDIKAIVKANPELKAAIKSAHTEDYKAKMEENKAIRSAFAAAIKAKDADNIKASLATILTKLQDRNKVMATKLAALQKAVTEQAASTPTTDPAPTTPTE